MKKIKDRKNNSWVLIYWHFTLMGSLLLACVTALVSVISHCHFHLNSISSSSPSVVPSLPCSLYFHYFWPGIHADSGDLLNIHCYHQIPNDLIFQNIHVFISIIVKSFISLTTIIHLHNPTWSPQPSLIYKQNSWVHASLPPSQPMFYHNSITMSVVFSPYSHWNQCSAFIGVLWH